MKHYIAILIFCSLFVTFAKAEESQKVRLYVGTYTGNGEKDSKGIYTSELDLKDGSLSQPRLVAECASPAFLAVHPKKPFMYAVGEVWGGNRQEGSVYSFAIDEKTGGLKQLNTETVPGNGPCHLCVATSEGGEKAAVVVACYGGGTVASLPVLEDGKLGKFVSSFKHEGELGPNKRRQEAPHPHGAYYVHKDEMTLILVPDLGLDSVWVYHLNFDPPMLSPVEFLGTNLVVKCPPGSGPRHLAEHPSLDCAFIVNELDSTVGFIYGDEKMPTFSTLPEGVTPESCGNTTAEIMVHPNGKFVYASNRGHDSIAVFQFDKAATEDKTLTQIQVEPCGGKEPRSFCIDPTGQYMIVGHQKSGTVGILKIDPNTGKLSQTDHKITIPQPVCVIVR